MPIIKYDALEASKVELEGAMNVYRSIVAEFSDLFTESGRPLELTSRLAMLDAFRFGKNHESFFQESLLTLRLMEQNTWALDGEQIKVYTSDLKKVIDEVLAESLSGNIPENYVQSVGDFQNAAEAATGSAHQQIQISKQAVK